MFTTRITVKELEEILNSKPRQELIKGVNLKLNNNVTIINPSMGQQSGGIIVGASKDNLAKIKMSNGNAIRIITINIQIQK